MSIIHKALKKAEETKEKDKKARIWVFGGRGGKDIGLWVAALGAAALAAVFAVYIYPALKPQAREAKVIPARAVPAPTPVKSAAVLLEEAVRDISLLKYAGAEKLLREALAVEPENPSLHNHLGLSLKGQGRLKEAVSEYEKAIELKADYHVAMNNLAVVMEAEGRKDRAEAMYKKALSLNPQYPEAHLNYALLLESAKRPFEAKAHYRAFLGLSTDEEAKALVRKRLR